MKWLVGCDKTSLRGNGLESLQDERVVLWLYIGNILPSELSTLPMGVTCADGSTKAKSETAGKLMVSGESPGNLSHRQQMKLVVFVLDSLMLSFPDDVFCEDVRGESDNCNAEAGKEVGEHCAVGEHRVSPPGVTLGPVIE